MTAVNHAALGAVIAMTVKEPVLVLPLAFISHFVLDALPHFGYPVSGFGEALKHRLTYLYLLLDVIGLAILLWVIIGSPWLVYIAAFIACTPDLVWTFYYFGYERKGKEPPGKKYMKFHSQIQWFVRPWGIWIEVAFAALLIYLVSVL